ncbi:PLP-dependent transferase [Cryphonectria parasitica EP155]|uniref:PLP-dependent transferase n=1 Tax=Cryphonectria parasitica (strain ATCC 38755 / EP155) TaxID=660469 RepID=A0A9P4Y5D5_CRYP1|nr:PLP-dependent transferase [Cryphonectria parasitica EP155]KAF3766811.1 PLP-dependent transferase [Cryphonectria parasitica EP155]
MSAEDALDAAIARFKARNPCSEALYRQAVESLPGGNTRTQLYTFPFPVYMKSGQGYQVTSEDGHIYTDMVGELTAGLYGHSHPTIITTIKNVLDTVGLSLGATTAQEHVYAATLCERFALDRVRFCNSGTEANLQALVAARAYTGKRRVVVFSAGYHGGVLGFAGGRPGPGAVDRGEWVVVDYNDSAGAEAAIRGENVAAVLVEAMQGSGGAIPGTHEFLKTIEAVAKDAGVLFILDEVMTSRLAPGGLAEVYHIQPDLKTFGKFLGGGLAFGAFGGRAEIMSVFDPRLASTQPLPLAHHGTFNNNTLVMHAGHAGLTKVYTPEACRDLNAQGDRLRAQLLALTQGTKMSFTGVGAVVGSHFTEQGFQAIQRCTEEDGTLKQLFWFEMMEEGFWLTQRGIYALILGTPQEELDRFVGCVEAFLNRHQALARV